MKQNENTKGTKNVKDKISDGFFQGIGALPLQLITVFVGSLFGVYFGGRPMVEQAKNEVKNEVKNQKMKQDSIMAMLDTISYIVNSKNDFDKAKKYELDGFHSLIDKKYGEAIWNFTMSQNSANSYHASLEISEYLRNHGNSVSEPNFWENTYSDMIQDERIRDFIPSDIRKKMDEYIRSHD